MELSTFLLHAALVIALFGIAMQGSSHTGLDIDLQQDRKIRLHSLARHAFHMANRRDTKFPAIALVCNGCIGETIRKYDPALPQCRLNHLSDILRT